MSSNETCNEASQTSHQPGELDRHPGTFESQPGTSRQRDNSAQPPAANPSQPGPDWCRSVTELNANMSAMSALLKHFVESGAYDSQPSFARSAHKRHHGNQLSEPSDSEGEGHSTREKRPRQDDEISLAASDDDLQELLAETKGVEANDGQKNSAQEDDCLKSLEADLNVEEPVGPKIQKRLANIAEKRWGMALSNE